MVGTRRHPEVGEPAATSDKPPLKSPESAKGKARPAGKKTASQQQLTAAGDTGRADSPAARNIEQPDVKDPEATAVPDAVNPSNTEHQQQQQGLPQPHSSPNKQKRKQTDTAAVSSPALAAPSQQSTGYDLLPTELLQQLQELKQSRPQQLAQGKSAQTQQQQQQVTRKAKKKQRLVEVQKGPVRVAVLPAVAGAAAGGGQQQQQQSTGASLRQQLLESRLHRSRAML